MSDKAFVQINQVYQKLVNAFGKPFVQPESIGSAMLIQNVVWETNGYYMHLGLTQTVNQPDEYAIDFYLEYYPGSSEGPNRHTSVIIYRTAKQMIAGIHKSAAEILRITESNFKNYPRFARQNQKTFDFFTKLNKL